MDIRDEGAAVSLLVEAVVSKAEKGMNKEKCNNNCAEYSVCTTNILVKL
jgi:hypothetical protein